jgi:hypothetical protein
MRHLNLEELLALEDGEELGELAQHLGSCGLCTAQRQALERRREQMRALPLLAPPVDRWLSIRAKVVARRRMRRVALAGALAAAVLAFVVMAPNLGLKRPSNPAATDELSDLVVRSQLLEEKLRSLPDPEVMDVSSAETIVELEDQIALVDQCIGELGETPDSGPELAVLWQTRIALLETLANMRSPAFALLVR